MQREQIIDALREKLDRNWNDYVGELDGLSKGVLIGDRKSTRLNSSH